MEPVRRTHPTIALLLFLTASFAVSFIGTQPTIASLPNWYAGLSKPAWNPPGWLFGPVWTVLYVCMAWAAWRVWRSNDPLRGKALGLWFVQLALNGLWSWIFFGWHRLGLAAAEIGVLWLAILGCILLFRRIDRAAAWAMAPYLAWVTFASVLNVTIWRLNP